MRPLLRTKSSLQQFCSQFENMKKNPHLTPTSGLGLPLPKATFMRKGIVGESRNHFDEETMEQWDKMIQERVAGTGLEEIEFFKLKH